MQFASAIARVWIAVSCAVALCAGSAAHAAGTTPDGELARLASAVPSIDPHVLDLALRASRCAQRRGLLPEAKTLTVVDYARPSTEPRLWVLDIARRVLVHEELVAHGIGSGENKAARFSNDVGSRQSSLGLFVTLDTYFGRHGRSLRLQGLEAGINDKAYERAIVVHGADYVTRAFAALHGRLGRSWGCPALAAEVAQRVIDRIRGGTPLFAYYPDQKWLQESRFLGSCGEAHATGTHDAGAASTPRS